ncbi:suppressor of forked protein (Suf) domain-containing protein [Ditylenchus destructor]|nr:suppressor of forked protein (Suf) domain-containing protein [Ditylenchus destructor]
MEQVTRGINRQAVSIPPRGSTAELKQAELWRKYIQWEKGNPLNTEEYGQLAKRVIFAYEQALLCLGYMPDIWYEAALFQQQAAQQLAEKGDVKLSTAITSEIIQLYERAISGLMKENQLLYFAYSDYEEERRNYENVKKIYNRILLIEHVDPTLPYIQLMKFTRRTEGVKTARLIFKRAREDNRSKFHVYDPQVAMRIFDLGLKKFANDADYALAYVEFLSHLNEDNNTRVIFERLLSSGALAPEKAVEIWDKYLEFESQKQTRQYASTAPTPNGVAQNGRAETAASKQAGTSVAAGSIMEMSGFPRPDTTQMLPFKPKLPSAVGYQHPVAGGAYPPPPAVAQLLQHLPPPWTFLGPFPDIKLLLESLAKFNREPPKANTKDSLDPNASFGGYKAADVKKELFQLLSTTTDPAVVLASHEYQQSSSQTRKRQIAGRHDSDSEDESSRQIGGVDIYKRRMNMKAGD